MFFQPLIRHHPTSVIFNFLFIFSGIIFFAVAVGIWRKKHWSYISGFLLNLIFTFLSGAFVIFTIRQPCEGLGCIGIVVSFILFWIIATITLVANPLLWFYWRSIQKNEVEPIKIKRQAILLGLILAVFWLASVAGSYYYFLGVSVKSNAIREKSLLEFKQKADIVYPSYTPKGWEKGTEYADSEGFKIFYNFGKGNTAVLVEIANFGTPQPLDLTKYYSESSIIFREDILIGGKKGLYFVTTLGLGSNQKPRGQSLWWSSENLDFRLGVSLSEEQSIPKEELIKVAESMILQQ